MKQAFLFIGIIKLALSFKDTRIIKLFFTHKHHQIGSFTHRYYHTTSFTHRYYQTGSLALWYYPTGSASLNCYLTQISLIWFFLFIFITNLFLLYLLSVLPCNLGDASQYISMHDQRTSLIQIQISYSYSYPYKSDWMKYSLHCWEHWVVSGLDYWSKAQTLTQCVHLLAAQPAVLKLSSFLLSNLLGHYWTKIYPLFINTSSKQGEFQQLNRISPFKRILWPIIRKSLKEAVPMNGH